MQEKYELTFLSLVTKKICNKQVDYCACLQRRLTNMVTGVELQLVWLD